MRRRELLAGIGSIGVLGTAGTAAVYGVPSIPGLTGDEGERRHDPVPIQTLDAPGSESGEISVPNERQVMFVDLFATDCIPCRDQMPELREAHDRIGDEVQFVSVTNESEDVVTDEDVADWWNEYDGNWTVGRDTMSDLIVHYGAATPIAIAFDSDGRLHWEESGKKTADTIVTELEAVLRADRRS